MDLAHLAAALLLVSSPGETVLLDFRADYCGPCRQMDPVIGQLAAEGFPVRKVNVDEPQNRGLAQKFGVSGIPCFVLLVDGQEVDRVVGATSREEIAGLFRKGKVGPNVRTARGQSPEPSRPELQAVPFPATAAQGSLASAGNAMPPARINREPALAELQPLSRPAEGQHDHLVRASVRLRIEDEKGNSKGSGTIIDAREGEALILTCGHVFREAAKSGKIWVDFFGPSAPRDLPGKLVAYDLNSDIGLLSVETNFPVQVAHLAPPNLKLKRGDKVISVGCDGGADATPRETQVTSINRYTEPKANIQVGFQPVQGRSGGGLFTPEGWVVGVCNAADPQDNEGLFAALPVVQEELDKAGLSFVYRNTSAGQHAVADGRLQAAAIGGQETANRSQGSAVIGQDVRSGDQEWPTRGRANGTASLVSASESQGKLSTNERAALEMLHAKSQEAEVVCIIRPKGDPNAKSEIIVLDHVSTNFARQLSEGRQPNNGRQQLTSLESARPLPPIQHPAQTPQSKSTGNLPRTAELKLFKMTPWWAENLD